MPWPAKKLGEVLEYEQPTQYIVGSTNYRNDYSIPVLTAGKSFILGYTNETDGVFPKEKLPVIIFDDFTTESKFVDFLFKVKSSAMKILRARKDQADTKFLFFKMQTIKFPHNQHKRYWISEYSKIRVPLPPLLEQKKIVAKIENLFTKIDEASRLRAEASEAAAALLPSAIHEVLLRGEKEGWKEVLLQDITELNPSKSEIRNIPNELTVSFVPMSAVDAETRSIKNQQVRPLWEVRRGYTYFAEDDVIFAKITPSMENGKIAVCERLENSIGFGTTEFHVIRPIKNVISKWLLYYLWNPAYREEAERHMTGTAGQQRVPPDFLAKSKIPLPSIPEQNKIVTYLDSLSAKTRDLQKLQSQTTEDFSALRQSILNQAFK